MKMKKGDRVGVIVGTDNEKKVLEFLGYGTYEGDEVPPKGMLLLGMDLSDLGMKNPKLVLDNGLVVWGCQTWWGPEEKVKALLEKHKGDGFKIVNITPKKWKKMLND